MKSPPELWAEISDPDTLARHLGAFGEIRITRLEPEATVAWEGDRTRGTVNLTASGWGTKVHVTAEPVGEPAAAEEAVAAAQAPAAEEEPPAEDEPEPRKRRGRGLLARLFGRRTEEPMVEEPEPAPIVPPAADADEIVIDRVEPAAVLDGMLDTLGAAHHRPFSREYGTAERGRPVDSGAP